MATPVTMTRSQYDSLILAAEGDSLINVGLIKDAVDKANGISRYLLHVRWYEQGGDAPTRIEIADGVEWPSQLSFKLVQNRPISREDVDVVLETQATNPLDPMVSRDPLAIVGWTLLDDYSFVANAS